MPLSTLRCALALSLLLPVGCARSEEPALIASQVQRAEESARAGSSDSLPPGSADIAPAAPAAGPAAAAQRQLIRSVSLSLEVDSLADARTRIEAQVRTAGGFVEGLSSHRLDDVEQLQMTLRVPSARLDELLGQLRALGRVERETQQVDDVTRRLVDVEARRRNILRTEQRLLELLARPQSGLADVLSVEKELSRVREAAELLDAELRTLGEQVALSKVDLALTHDLDRGVLGHVWTPWRQLFRDAGQIMGDSIAGLVALGATLTRIALYALPWTPVAMLVWLGLRALRRRRAQRRARSLADAAT